uniref:Uncharacterized protein n=1 Tax=Knipowitschia caucasica TaxID=637954 RepID=A0AAV2M5X2_KNICA
MKIAHTGGYVAASARLGSGPLPGPAALARVFGVAEAPLCGPPARPCPGLKCESHIHLASLGPRALALGAPLTAGLGYLCSGGGGGETGVFVFGAPLQPLVRVQLPHTRV